MQLMEMTWEEVAEYLGLLCKRLVIIPCGSVEQHSLSMPIGTDTYIAEAISIEVAQRVEAIMMPPITPGLSRVPHMAFAGTISLSSKTLIAVVTDYVLSAYHHGFRDFLFVNAHGLNAHPVNAALQDLAYDLTNMRYVYQDWWTIPAVSTMLDEHFTAGGHATAGELSLMLYLYPHLVRSEMLREHSLTTKCFVSLDLVRQITDTGMIGGNQLEASPELGSALFEAIVEGYTSLAYLFIDQK
jgi:creatinine amidohydrolase